MHILFVTFVASAFWSWLHRLGGAGLILLGIADNSAIPLPGSMDVFTILLAAHKPEWWPYYAFMATAGAVLGGYLTYRLAEKGGEETFEKKIGKKRAKGVYKRFEKKGSLWVFLGAILPPPFPIVPVLMAAGVLHHPKKKFVSALAAGRGVRYFALAYVGHTYGPAIVSFLSRYYQPVLYALISLAALGAVAALLYFKYYRPRKRNQQGLRAKPGEPFPPGRGDQRSSDGLHPEEREARKRTA